MRVNIDEIKEGGLRRAWDLSRETVDDMVSGDPAGHRAASGLHIEGDFRKVERRVLFRGRATARLAAPCRRCLTSVDAEVPLDVQMTFVPVDASVAEDDAAARAADDHGRVRVAGSFAPTDVNEETYAGKIIDVDPFLREQLVLALPGYPVCDESCKGLCSVCGTNLNERDCGCDRHVPDPRWAGLEKLKQSSKEE